LSEKWGTSNTLRLLSRSLYHRPEQLNRKGAECFIKGFARTKAAENSRIGAFARTVVEGVVTPLPTSAN